MMSASNKSNAFVLNEDKLSTKVELDLEKAPSTGATLSFHDISCTIEIKVKRRRIKKTILKNINGVFEPGMNAILGPTGSGKTSLLEVLAARRDLKGISGSVLIDSASLPKNFKCTSGYVVQDDIVMGTLTVRENLAFSAALRLPKDVSRFERDQRVCDIIEELGLTPVADSRVGTEFVRGVSGGERKRTNVGMELITKPSVLFLDEPTTGLDASTANAVMHLLARLSRRGRTIIFSIHQPRFSIFRLFDKMHLLGKGQTIYHGPAQDALQYFSSIGYECEEHNNPPDFFLDVISGDHPVNANGSTTTSEYDQDDAEIVKPGKTPTDSNEDLLEMYNQSDLHRHMKEKEDAILTQFHNNEEVDVPTIAYPTYYCTQLHLVSRRAITNIIRNPFLIAIQIISLIVIALVIGIIFFQLDKSITFGFQNRAGAFFFVALQVMFRNTGAVEVFLDERVIFIHESASGYYRSSVYFLAKVATDIILLRLVPTLIYSLITYWMLGLQPSAHQFFIYLLTLVLVSLGSTSLAFAISSSVTIKGIGTLAVTGFYVLMAVFGGLLVNIQSLPVWLRWIQYLSLIRYGLNAMLSNEIKDMEFCDTAGNATNCVAGTSYLQSQGISYSVRGLWGNELALAAIAITFLLISYVQLRRIPKLK